MHSSSTTTPEKKQRKNNQHLYNIEVIKVIKVIVCSESITRRRDAARPPRSSRDPPPSPSRPTRWMGPRIIKYKSKGPIRRRGSLGSRERAAMGRGRDTRHVPKALMDGGDFLAATTSSRGRRLLLLLHLQRRRPATRMAPRGPCAVPRHTPRRSLSN